MKVCRGCLQEKPSTEFYARKTSPDGMRSRCKACEKAEHKQWMDKNPIHRREYHQKLFLKRNYGITDAQYQELFAAQGGVCAICEAPPKPTKRLGVDHNHSTGQVRGLLCDRCNMMIGFSQESTDNLRKAAAYLSDWQATMNREAA